MILWKAIWPGIVGDNNIQFYNDDNNDMDNQQCSKSQMICDCKPHKNEFDTNYKCNSIE